MADTIPQTHTTDWYELRIRALEEQIKVKDDTITKQSDIIATVNKGRREVAVAHIVERGLFKEDELSDKSDEQVFAIEATAERMPSKAARVGGVVTDAKPDTGLTAGRWNAAKKEWEA
jgi:hypothetical protein